LLESLDPVVSGGSWRWKTKDDAKIVEALNEQYEAQKRALDARFEDKGREGPSR
jgi:hypothetical protein